jgi:hypothetical protein
MKKTSSKRISGRSNNKEAKADANTVRGPSKEAGKKLLKKVKAKNSGKRNDSAGGKVGAKAGIKEEKESARAPIQKKTKTPEEKPAVQGRKKPGVAKKRIARYAPKKAAAGKVVAEVKKKTKENREKARKVAAGEKKYPVGKVKETDIKRAAEKRETRTGVGVKRKSAVTTEKAVKKHSREAVRKIGTRRTAEIAGERTKPGIKQKKDVYPSAIKEYQPIPRETLPAEYGENEVTLMPVDPHKLFVFWEVRKDTMGSYEGDLTIRVYDVVGDGFNTADAGSYFDIAAHERVGRRYIDVRPAKKFIAHIGISHGGIFTAIARSARVSTPCAGVFPAADLSRKHPEDDTRVGY